MMKSKVSLQRNHAGVGKISAHLRACDAAFVPPLSQRLAIDAYSEKIVTRAERFEAWSDDDLVGLLAAYCNDSGRRSAFVTSVSVMPQWQGLGVASRLLQACIDHATTGGFQRIELEVDVRNAPAALLYTKHGFSVARTEEGTQTMQLTI
jgi:ribosomal protein S18 acetylase RimI-like enzyme